MSKQIGTNPNQVPTNADLGTMAYMDYDAVAPVLIGGRRNMIINGAMQVAQRGTSTLNTNGSIFVADRFTTTNSGFGGTADLTRESEGPDGFKTSVKISCNTAAGVDSGDYYGLSYNTENQDLDRVAFGTSAAKPLVLSFWVKGNVTGQYVAWMYRYSGTTRHVAVPYTIEKAGVWEKKTLYFPPDTSGGAITNGPTDNGMILRFMLVAGTTWSSGTAPSYWQDHATANRWVDQEVNLFSAVGNYWQITGVQLELGSVATPFEHRSYGEELALCQRYYMDIGTVLRDTNAYTASAWDEESVAWIGHMRAEPSISFTTSGNNYYNAGIRIYPNWNVSKTLNVYHRATAASADYAMYFEGIKLDAEL